MGLTKPLLATPLVTNESLVLEAGLPSPNGSSAHDDLDVVSQAGSSTSTSDCPQEGTQKREEEGQ